MNKLRPCLAILSSSDARLVLVLRGCFLLQGRQASDRFKQSLLVFQVNCNTCLILSRLSFLLCLRIPLLGTPWNLPLQAPLHRRDFIFRRIIRSHLSDGIGLQLQEIDEGPVPISSFFSRNNLQLQRRWFKVTRSRRVAAGLVSGLRRAGCHERVYLSSLKHLFIVVFFVFHIGSVSTKEINRALFFYRDLIDIVFVQADSQSLLGTPSVWCLLVPSVQFWQSFEGSLQGWTQIECPTLALGKAPHTLDEKVRGCLAFMREILHHKSHVSMTCAVVVALVLGSLHQADQL
mmetsp:Transcript_4194/g.10160  ORF Transcript_4194/g.10160 Transcript_4194/m.10160 type:complete len:290 (+) Transcript_4194:1835-2704(+)